MTSLSLKNYDYILVGSGPTALSLAWYLSKFQKKILIIERESSAGGCHRVRRVEVNGIKYFTEHGPRIYINNYHMFQTILSDIGVSWDNIFTKYNFGMNVSLKQILSVLSMKEFVLLGYEFLKCGLSDEYAKKTSLLEFMTYHTFSKKTQETIDRICRLTDGGRIDNYTLFEFLEVFNQNFFYQTYQPRLPNDECLIKLWVDHLLKTGNVDILYNTEITNIIGNHTIEGVLITSYKGLNKQYTANKIIFTIPPRPFVNILENTSKIIPGLNALRTWSEYSSYITYIPVTLHWKKNISLPKIWGSTDTDWGIIFVVLSDYMTFVTEGSSVVISVTATLTDVKSSFTNKSADESSAEEVVQEIFRQLSSVLGSISQPDIALLSPGVYKVDNKWVTKDTAFVNTKLGHVPFVKIPTYEDVFWIGTHSGKSSYNFTSMEAAVENGIWLAKELEPGFKVESAPIITVRTVILPFFILLILFLIYKNKD